MVTGATSAEPEEIAFDASLHGRDALRSEDGHGFHILLAKKAYVEAKIEKIQKRAVRKGLTPVTFTWGKAYRPFTMEPTGAIRIEAGKSTRIMAKKFGEARIPLTIAGDAPKYNGWTFVASLQHLEGENLVRALPDQDVPAEYRTRGPICDHCKSSRRRVDTYVLRHEGGRYAQVGSSCIGDFLGRDDAHTIAMNAMYWADLAGCGDDEWSGSGRSDHAMLEEFLPFVAFCMREAGWVSRTAARDRGGMATADTAWWYLTDVEMREKHKVHPTEADGVTASEAIAWAESISDADVERERGDFLHNIRAIARSSYATSRTAGLAAAIIIAHHKAIGRERERAARAARPRINAHVGDVGKRETWTVTLDMVTGYETAYGYTTLLKFLTDEGATIVWKATGETKSIDPVAQAKEVALLKASHARGETPWNRTGEVVKFENEIDRTCVGKRYSVKGTVKKHDEYKGSKQTIVARCAVTEIPEAPGSQPELAS